VKQTTGGAEKGNVSKVSGDTAKEPLLHSREEWINPENSGKRERGRNCYIVRTEDRAVAMHVEKLGSYGMRRKDKKEKTRGEDILSHLELHDDPR